jgi:transposase
MSTSVTRKTLNLDDKLKAINLCDGGKSCRAVAEEMGVGVFLVTDVDMMH